MRSRLNEKVNALTDKGRSQKLTQLIYKKNPKTWNIFFLNVCCVLVFGMLSYKISFFLWNCIGELHCNCHFWTLTAVRFFFVNNVPVHTYIWRNTQKDMHRNQKNIKVSKEGCVRKQLRTRYMCTLTVSNLSFKS